MAVIRPSTPPRRNLAKEDFRTLCPQSPTGIHYHVVVWDDRGPTGGPFITCECCRKPIKALFGRWVEDTYVIHEPEEIDDL